MAGRMPSWNSLAAQLGVARGTVKAAYDWLAGEGYIVGRGAAGTIVPSVLKIHCATRQRATRPILPADADDEALERRAVAAGLAVKALSSATIRTPRAPALMLSVTNVAARNAARDVRRLAQALAF